MAVNNKYELSTNLLGKVAESRSVKDRQSYDILKIV